MKPLFCLLIIIVSIFLIVLSFFLNEVRKYLIWKRNITSDPVRDAGTIISFTNDFMSLLSGRIDEEINIHFQKYVLLDETYPLQKLDDDIKYIAQTVYDGIKPAVFEFNKNDFAFTTEYLMQFIVNTTRLRVTGYMKEWNDQKHSLKM